MKRGLFFPFCVLISSLLFSPGVRSDQPICDEEMYRLAAGHVASGRTGEALDAYRAMLSLSAEEIWTAQALLVCDEKELPAAMESLRNATGEKVLILKRMVDSTLCFRLCAGIFKNKQQSLELARNLPSPFKEAKPYPLKLVSKGAYSLSAFDSADYGNEKGTAPILQPRENPYPHEKDAAGDLDAAASLFVKGLESYNKGDLASAETYFKQAIALRPERFETYNNLGALYLEQRRYKEAKEILEKAVTIQPSYPNSRANLAGAYWFLGERDEAISEAQRAFRLDSHNVRYSLNLASFLYEQERYDEARTYVNVAKMISPGNADVLSLESKLNEKTGHAPSGPGENAAPTSDEGGQDTAGPENVQVGTGVEREETDRKKRRFRDIFRKKSDDKEGE